LLAQAQFEWHGVALKSPDWSDDSHSIALKSSSLRGRFMLHAMLNAYWEALTFQLPLTRAQNGTRWRRWIDTSLPSLRDICAWEDAPIVSESTYVERPHSMVFLIEANRSPPWFESQ
jgi:glycogen operon protein